MDIREPLGIVTLFVLILAALLLESNLGEQFYRVLSLKGTASQAD